MKTRKVGDRHFPANEPHVTVGNWSATPELKWQGTVLMQKFKRRVKRDWGHAVWSRTMEYKWFPVPRES